MSLLLHQTSICIKLADFWVELHTKVIAWIIKASKIMLDYVNFWK